MLRQLDERQRIRFGDISAEEFDATTVGVSGEALMDRIHGRLLDGTLIEEVEVFRRLYSTPRWAWRRWSP
ncbi:MAG: DUF393 domain-containing protein [Burkholderiales bacterium]|nr:DUF393 domain-containing protein [Burkholderiales bacterium]